MFYEHVKDLDPEPLLVNIGAEDLFRSSQAPRQLVEHPCRIPILLHRLTYHDGVLPAFRTFAAGAWRKKKEKQMADAMAAAESGAPAAKRKRALSPDHLLNIVMSYKHK